MKPSALFLAVAALAGVSASAITIPVTEDTFSNAKSTIGLASGKATSLAITSKNRAFIFFALTSLPQGTTADMIGGARLQIFTNRVLKPGSLEIRTATSSWSENADNNTAAPTVDNAPLPLASLVVPVGKHFFTVDITDAVKAWVTDPDSNHGLAFISKDAVGKFYLGSKEGSGTGHFAALEIDLPTVIPPGVLDNNGQIDGQSLKAGTVGNTQLATDSVLAGNLGSNAVTLAKLNTDSVDSSKIVDGSVDTADLTDNAVKTAKINDGAVTNAKLASGIDGAKIADGSVTNVKLAAGIDGAKLADGSVTNAKLASGIDGSKIADGSISASKFAIPQVFVKVHKDSTQTIASGSAITITDWTEDYDASGAFNPMTGVFTAPTAGKYRVTWLALLGQTFWGQGDSVELRAGGETLGGNTFQVALLAALTHYVNGTDTYQLNANATLQFAVSSSHNTSILAANGGSNRLTIERIGD
jgi:hypothetical protein